MVTLNVLPYLNVKFGENFKFEHVKNKIRSWKRKIEPIELLMKNNSGFGWDPTTQRITCSDEVWDNYKQVSLLILKNKYLVYLGVIVIFKLIYLFFYRLIPTRQCLRTSYLRIWMIYAW